MLEAFLTRRLLHLVVAPLLASGPLALGLLPEERAVPLRERRLPPLHIRIDRVPPEIVKNSRVVDTLVDIPPAWRRKNWIGARGEGSCVHAAMRHLFHWQEQHELAEWWAQQHADGETFAGLAIKLDRAGVRWAGTDDGDVEFLQWAIHTRRGAGVVIRQGRHMVNLVGLDSQAAYILDSNQPDVVDAWPREYFLREWQEAGGWAVTPVYSASPPTPHQ